MIPVIVCGALSVAAVLVRQLFFKSGKLIGFGCKVLASFLFCIAGLFAVLERGIDPQSALMLAAFFLAFAGDILLALAGFVDEKSNTFFSAVGGAAFLIGHIMYIVVFLSAEPLKPYLIPVFLILPAAYAVLVKKKLINPGKNTLPVMIYSAVLGAMATSVVNLAVSGNGGGIFALIAGILFVLSDTALFIFNFGSERVKELRGKWFVYCVFIPYYIAQGLFALCLVYL